MRQVDTAEILEHVPAVVFRLSHVGDDWKTLYVTENVSMFGYRREDFLDGSMAWFEIVHPDDRVLVSKTVQDYEAHHINEFRMYYRVVTQNGDSVPITEYNTVNRDSAGNILSYDTVIVTSSVSVASQDLIDNHYRQQIVLNDILMSLHDSDLDHALQIILDRTGEYLDTSRALLFKDSPDHKTCKVIYEWDNRGITSVMDLDYSITYETGMPEIYIALQTTGNLIVNFGQIPENCKEEFEAEGLIASAIFAIYQGGEHFGFVCFDDCVVERTWDEDTVRFLKNISNLISTVIARQHTAEQLAESQKTIGSMAYTDYLTKLANRFSCDRELQAAMEETAAAGHMGYLLFIDMDDFKIVNDCYGHDYGDAILVSFADYLRGAFPEPHRVFRFGGDEFVVLLDSREPVDIEATLDGLRSRAEEPWQAMDRSFYCTLSIGVVTYPSMDMDSRTVIKRADIAMYEAKRRGKNRYFIYDTSLDSSPRERTQMEGLLRRAMQNNFEGFEIYYQPIVNNATQKIEGAEALLRVRDGDSVILPADFLPLAEYLGFTVPIGEHVFKTAMELCRKINQNGFPDFKMCVNMSHKQLQQKDVLARMEQMLGEVGVRYENVIISMSEKTVLEDPDRMTFVCGRLREIGVSVTLDDFGGGSDSFSQLGKLPVDNITTSMGLIENVGDHYAREFIALIIGLCHSMDKEICINGIETESQYIFCRACGTDKLQGFYLYNVIDAAKLTELLHA